MADQRLASFRAAHPDIKVRISAGMRLVDLAREGIDVAIRHGRGDWPGLCTERLTMADCFAPVCSPALLKGLRTPADLAAHTLL